MTPLNTHEIPSGGWKFRQVQTGWEAPSPISNTFDQQTVNIIKHRMKNPAIVAKHQLSMDKSDVARELMKLTGSAWACPSRPIRRGKVFSRQAAQARLRHLLRLTAFAGRPKVRPWSWTGCRAVGLPSRPNWLFAALLSVLGAPKTSKAVGSRRRRQRSSRPRSKRDKTLSLKRLTMPNSSPATCASAY